MTSDVDGAYLIRSAKTPLSSSNSRVKSLSDAWMLLSTRLSYADMCRHSHVTTPRRASPLMSIRGEALRICLQNSDCIMVERRPASQCLRPPHRYELPEQCQQLQKGLGECKRGLIDMRKRFRGNRPIGLREAGVSAVGQVDAKRGTIEERGYMLYAGRPHRGVRESSGNEDPESAGDSNGEQKK